MKKKNIKSLNLKKNTISILTTTSLLKGGLKPTGERTTDSRESNLCTVFCSAPCGPTALNCGPIPTREGSFCVCE